MEKERIEFLIAKNVLTKSERNEIREAAKKAGMNVKFRQACRTCYETALLNLYELTDDKIVTSADGYVFRRRGDSFRCNGKLYNESTLPDIEVVKLHPNIIRMYFLKYTRTNSESDESKIQVEPVAEVERGGDVFQGVPAGDGAADGTCDGE